MRLQMRPQVRPVRERPVAVVAGERLLPRVRPYVSLEQPRPGERLAAHGAFAWQGVGPDMHLQRAEGDVDLLAVLATELLLRTFACGAVELPVFRQAGKGGVTLPAIRTLVSRALPSLVGGQIFRISTRRWRSRQRRTRTQGILIYGRIYGGAEGYRGEGLLHVRVNVRWRQRTITVRRRWSHAHVIMCVVRIGHERVAVRVDLGCDTPVPRLGSVFFGTYRRITGVGNSGFRLDDGLVDMKRR